MSAKKLKLSTADKSQRKITFFTQNTDCSDSTVPSTDDAEVPDRAEDDQPSKTESKPTEIRKFQPRWLAINKWLKYDSDKNKMYCKSCIDAGLNNALTSGSDNFKTSTLTRHVASADHQRAILAPTGRQEMKSAVGKALNNEEEGIILAMKVVYWLTQEDIPLTKYSSLIKFMKDCKMPYADALNVNSRVNYNSYYTAVDLLTSLSNVIDTNITEKINASPVVTILTDESTDIVVHHKLCISTRIVDPITLQPSTLFLTDVRIEKATGKGMYDEIQKQLRIRNIDCKIMGLGTDGASAMTGRKEGLTGQFLKDNPHLVNTHCVAHRLALCTEQSAKLVPAMNEYQRTLEMIYYHFKKSPKKVDHVEAIQKLLEEPCLRYREVHEVRWLSFYEALDAVYRTMDSLITYLSGSSDAQVVGLKKRVGQELFISITYAMMDILQPIMRLCLVFQKKDLDIGVVQVSLDDCRVTLENLRDDRNPLGKTTFLSKLPEDVKNGVFKGHHVAKVKSQTQFQNVKTDFINAVLENISRRFPDTQLMTSLSVLGLRPITFLNDTELHDWGNEAIQRLVDFYGKDQQHEYTDPETKSKEVSKSEALVDPVAVKEEWQRLKTLVKSQQYPRPTMAVLWSLIMEYHREEFPNLIILAALALSHPVHTADCERAFSSQNLVTTALRNRLAPETCDKLMRIKIEGPNLHEFDFTKALLEWRKVRDRAIFRKTETVS